MSKLRDTSLKTGAGTPPPASKYTTDHGRTSKMPTMADTPRDGGGMSTGETGGNFAMDMGKIPNNAATGTQSGSDAAQTAFEANKQ